MKMRVNGFCLNEFGKPKSKSVSVNTPIEILSFKMPLAATHSNQNWKLKPSRISSLFFSDILSIQ
jgi:hypothetical protein